MDARRLHNARRTSAIAALGFALALAGGQAWSKKTSPDPDDPVEEAADVGPLAPAETEDGNLRKYKDKTNHKHALTLGTVEPPKVATRPQQPVLQLQSEKNKKDKKDKKDKG